MIQQNPENPAKPAITLQALANLVGAKLEGDPNCQIFGLATLGSAKEGELSFLTQARFRSQLQTTKASALLLSNQDGILENGLWQGNALTVKNPRLALAKVAQWFEEQAQDVIVCHGQTQHVQNVQKVQICNGQTQHSETLHTKTLHQYIHPTAIVGRDTVINAAYIGPNAVIGDRVTLEDGVYVGAGVFVGNDCFIGKNTSLKPSVTLVKNVTIGENTLIHSGAVIGSDGFGFAEDNGQWVKMPHLGGVKIGDRVEIGANTTIDRGFLDDTIVDNGVIIDNLVQIGHNVQIGCHTAIAGCVAIGGSTKIGAYCLIGGTASIADNIEIADKVCITAMSGVGHSITEPGIYSSGMPAKPNRQWRKNIARFQNLDELAKRVIVLEKKLLDKQCQV